MCSDELPWIAAFRPLQVETRDMQGTLPQEALFKEVDGHGQSMLFRLASSQQTLTSHSQFCMSLVSKGAKFERFLQPLLPSSLHFSFQAAASSCNTAQWNWVLSELVWISAFFLVPSAVCFLQGCRWELVSGTFWLLQWSSDHMHDVELTNTA